MPAEGIVEHIGIPRDHITGAIETITSAHAGVHKGHVYTFTHSVASVASNGSRVVDIASPLIGRIYVKEVQCWAEGGVNI
jgi:hypothetical protein